KVSFAFSCCIFGPLLFMAQERSSVKLTSRSHLSGLLFYFCNKVFIYRIAILNLKT
ncbi:unnamed protein product, partial [Brassica napus]